MRDGEVVLIVLLIVTAFGVGFALGSPNFKMPFELRNRVEQDARSNYRDFEEHIGFIISKYYEEAVK